MGQHLDCRVSWVDVRDVADAHVKALSVPEAEGQRLIVAGGSSVWQDWSL